MLCDLNLKTSLLSDSNMSGQGELVARAAGTTLSSMRLRQRLTVIQRYLTALGQISESQREVGSISQQSKDSSSTWSDPTGCCQLARPEASLFDQSAAFKVVGGG